MNEFQLAQECYFMQMLQYVHHSNASTMTRTRTPRKRGVKINACQACIILVISLKIPLQ